MIELTVLNDSNVELNTVDDGLIGLDVVMATGGGGEIHNQNKTVTPTESEQSVTADVGYTGLGTVTVEGIDSDYVGSGVPRNTSSNLLTEGATVIAPSGYYENSATKTVQIGTAGTPTASKGAVSNHSVSVTPSVTNQAGYIYSETKTGTAVSVSASELVSGTKSISANGTEDVTNYASVSVSVPNSYSASDEGKVVDNGALVSQTSDTVTANDTYDTTLINSLTVNVSGGGGISVDGIAQNIAPSGEITLSNSVTTLADYAFAGKPITSIIAPSVKQIYPNSLQGTQITTITDANFPSLGVSEQVNIKFLMSSLVSIHLSGEKITLANGSGALRENTNLVRVELPNCSKSSSNKDMGNMCFYGDTKLEFVDIGFCKSIASNAFYNCSKLRTLVMRKTDAVVTLSNWNAGTMKGIYDNPTLSTIYVPNALLSTYSTATNWVSAYNAGVTFAKIEGSIYE